MHNFAHDSNLSAWGETVSKLFDTLESKSNITIDWLTKSEMVIHPDKFLAVILDKRFPFYRNHINQTSASYS